MSPKNLHVVAEQRLGCVDLTDAARAHVAASGVSDGALLVFCAHTTCSVLVNEWEPGAIEDVGVKLSELFPVEAYYAHDDPQRRTVNLVPDERRNGHAHVAQMVIGQSSQMVPISGGELLLGRWQRIFLLELDEPKERTIVLHAFGQTDTPAPGEPARSSVPAVRS